MDRRTQNWNADFADSYDIRGGVGTKKTTALSKSHFELN